MKLQSKFIITSTVVCAYLIIRETLKLERRAYELDIYEDGICKVIDTINKGQDIENVINIRFK